MNDYEKQFELIKSHFENISEEDLNKNLEKCGINEIKYNYIVTMVTEELSNIEMNSFVQSNEIHKEELKWEINQNQQVYAA